MYHNPAISQIKLQSNGSFPQSVSLMALSFLSRHPFEIGHVGGEDGRADDGKVVNLGNLSALLVVLEKELEVLHILELDEAKGNGTAVKLVWSETETKDKYEKGLLLTSQKEESA